MTDQELLAIEERALYSPAGDCIDIVTDEVPKLIAEIRRLQKRLAAIEDMARTIQEKVRESSRIVSELEALQEADRP